MVQGCERLLAAIKVPKDETMKMPQSGIAWTPFDGTIEAGNQNLSLARLKCSEEPVECGQDRICG
jgi:hypothetical protein